MKRGDENHLFFIACRLDQTKVRLKNHLQAVKSTLEKTFTISQKSCENPLIILLYIVSKFTLDLFGNTKYSLLYVISNQLLIKSKNNVKYVLL